jgi:hypothetical protein
MFAAALGYRRFDHARLIAQVLEGIVRHEAVPIDAVLYGERFRVDIPSSAPPDRQSCARFGS